MKEIRKQYFSTRNFVCQGYQKLFLGGNVTMWNFLIRASIMTTCVKAIYTVFIKKLFTRPSFSLYEEEITYSFPGLLC